MTGSSEKAYHARAKGAAEAAQTRGAFRQTDVDSATNFASHVVNANKKVSLQLRRNCFMSLMDTRHEQNSGVQNPIATDRRDFVKLAGTIAAAALLPLRSPAQSGTLQVDLDQGGGDSATTFLVGNQVLDAQKIKVGPVEVQYFECGSPDGVPLVLLHGFPDSPVAWQAVIKELDLTKYRIVLPFLRGYGKSVVLEPDYLGGQTAALAHDLLALTSALKIEKFHLAGHDWGARTAYSAAVLAPQRLLTLTGLASPYLAYKGETAHPAQVHGYWYQWYFQIEAAREMLTEHRQDFCRELWRMWCPQWRFTETAFAGAAAAWDNPQFVDIVIDYYRMRHGGSLSRRAYAEAQAKLDAKPQPKIGVPTLFIHGAADACDLPAGADGQEAGFTGGYERLLIPDVGHFPHRENARAVAQALLKQLHV